jgi:hypothetical protein
VRKMSSKKNLEHARVVETTRLINNTFRRHDNNIMQNKRLASVIDDFINSLERGDIYEEDFEVFTHYFNTSVLITAGNQKTNEDLVEMAEFFYDVLKFPVIDADCLVDLLREFQKRLIRAQSGHAVINEKIEQFAKIQVLSNKEILMPETVIPEVQEFFSKKEKNNDEKE